MSAGFVKLYGTILTSSIWLEDDATLRVWIAMLALADENGEIGASVGGLAHTSRVTREACEHALAVLLTPDPDSRTPDNEGRRIEAIKGGWRVLNHRAYRDLRSPKQIAEAERKARWREQRDAAGQNGTVHDVPTEVEAEAHTETTTTPLTPPREGSAIQELLARVPEPQVWRAEIHAMVTGMPGHRKATIGQVDSAAKDYLANGKSQRPNLRQFRRYVADSVAGESGQPSNGQRKARQSVAEQGYASAKAALQHIPDDD